MHTGSATDQPSPAVGSVDDEETWRIRRTAADLDRLGETESIFALGNGWVGWRGVLDEGAPCAMPGSYVNGFHERRELSYPEEGYAFPQASDTLVSAPNAALIRLWVDDEPLDIRTGTLHVHERVLDLRAGVLRRETEWVRRLGGGCASAAPDWCLCPAVRSPPSGTRWRRWTGPSNCGSARTCWPTSGCRSARTIPGQPR